jgi:hypothetical protein
MKSTQYQLDTFCEYIRTKQFCLNAIKGANPDSFVHVGMDEIKNRFLVNPREDINHLIEKNQIEFKIEKTPIGHDMFFYRVLTSGHYDLTLLNHKGKPLDSITENMMHMLKDVSLKPESENTPYFKSFVENKYLIRLFFSIDHFSGRVHTPITSLKGDIRKNILLDGEETISIDVVTMQPLLLGAILKNKVGDNEFSKWIDEGKDIYIMLQAKTNLSTREDAKKKFFEILFAHSNESLSKTFGQANWITWINEFKSKPFEPNPHTNEKNHSNLAWLLQTYEVKLMKEVWHQLLNHGIKFLSVHDEVIVKKKDHEKAFGIFQDVLSKQLSFFRLSDKPKYTEKHPKNNEETTIPTPSTASIQLLETIPRGKLFFPYELKEKFNLTDEVIQNNFEEAINGTYMIPIQF